MEEKRKGERRGDKMGKESRGEDDGIFAGWNEVRRKAKFNPRRMMRIRLFSKSDYDPFEWVSKSEKRVPPTNFPNCLRPPI